MTSIDRVLAAINFGKPDRVPRWDNYWPEFVENWRNHFGLGSHVRPEDYYGIDLVRLQANELFFPSEEGIVSEDSKHEVLRDGWGRIIRRPKGKSYFSETISSVLEEHADLDKISFEPTDLECRYTSLARSVAREKAAGRCVLTKVGGIYVRSQFLRGEENLLIDMYADPGFCDALFDKVLAHVTGIAIESLKRTNGWRVGLMVYDDMASLRSTMFSPAMFERYFLPRYHQLVKTLRTAGCEHVFFHSDGNIMPVWDMLLDAGFEGFHPLEPRCGYDLPKMRERYGKRAVFFGGVCNTQILPRGNKDEIERHVKPLIELGRGGGLIIGSASIGDDVEPETYDWYQSLLCRLGGDT